MPIYEHTANFPFSREDVWAWHARPGAIRRIMPGWEGIRPIEVGGIQNGAKTSFKISIGPIPFVWTTNDDSAHFGRTLLGGLVSGSMFLNVATGD